MDQRYWQGIELCLKMQRQRLVAQIAETEWLLGKIAEVKEIDARGQTCLVLQEEEKKIAP